MQMWYNDSMISSSKRRAKGYRFDSHEHAASFGYTGSRYIRDAHGHTQLTRSLMYRAGNAKGYNIATYDHISKNK